MIFYLIKVKNSKNSLKTNEYTQKMEEINQKINEELNIPSSIIKIDLLSTICKEKNGKVVAKKKYL